MKKQTIIFLAGGAAVIILIIILLSTRTPNQSNQLFSSSADDAIIESEAIFLSQIQQLQQIDLSRAVLLTDDRFTRLIDNTVVLDTETAGRENPFAPIDDRTKILRAAEQAAAAQQAFINTQNSQLNDTSDDVIESDLDNQPTTSTQ